MAVKLSKKEQLDILDELRYGLQWPKIKQKILSIEYTIHDQKQQQPFPTQQIIYQLPGATSKCSISHQTLQKKLQQYIEEPSPNPQLPTQQKQKIQDHQSQFQPHKQSKNQKCLNCLQLGHRTEYCLEENKCMYCISRYHYTQQCQQKNICFKCFQIGHQFEKCNNRDGKLCGNCERSHVRVGVDGACFSLTKGRDDKKYLFPTDSFYVYSEIMCMRCRKYGHLCCSNN